VARTVRRRRRVAIFSVTKTSFIIVAANIKATIAVRSWLSCDIRFHGAQAPRLALAVLLGGASLKLGHLLAIPPAALLIVVACAFGVGARSVAAQR